MQTADWGDLTRQANASRNHVKNLDRWRAIVREANPSLSDARVDRLAAMLRSQYFRDVANARWHPKDTAKRTDCECGSAGHGPDECPESAPERAA